MTEILFTKKFIEQLEKLPLSIQKTTYNKVALFRTNQKHPSLHTHKLHGKLKNYFAFSITDDIRIVFTHTDSGAIAFVKIGTHAIYK